jgi:hypothetical protein
VHGFNVAVETGILVDITPGKTAVIKRLVEILEIFQPVPVDIARTDRLVIPVNEKGGR